MDTESELQLYDYVDFLETTPISRTVATTVAPQSSNASRRKEPLRADNIHQRIGNSKKPAIRKEFRRPQLDPFELMFFSADYNALPLHTQLPDNDEYNRKQSYLGKIKRMSNPDKRKHRAERDLRYLHKNDKQSHQQRVEELDGESNLFCVHHLIGKCNKTTCNRVHQMRVPRLFGVCKFFLTKSCAKGESCEFMHSEFPCRFYYLDIDHPKSSNEDECQFSHGGPLTKEMNRHFKKHIEFWLKEKTSNKLDEIEKKLADFMERFDLKQTKLEEEHKNAKKEKNEIPRHSDKFTWECCLDENQLEQLKQNGIDSIEKINNAPVELLLKCGLKMDQIYKITVNTCDGTQNPVQKFTESDEEILEFGNSLEKVTTDTQQPIIGRNSDENKPGLDDQRESDVNEIRSECSSVPDLLEDLEMSDDSDTDDLVINEDI